MKTELEHLLSLATKLTNNGKSPFRTRDLTESTTREFANASHTVAVAVDRGLLIELKRYDRGRRFKLSAKGKKAQL